MFTGMGAEKYSNSKVSVQMGINAFKTLKHTKKKLFLNSYQLFYAICQHKTILQSLVTNSY